MSFRISIQALLSAAAVSAKLVVGDSSDETTTKSEDFFSTSSFDNRLVFNKDIVENAFIPKKLIEKYKRRAMNQKSASIHSPPLVHNQNEEDVSTENVLKNPSSYDENRRKDSISTSTTDASFDVSTDLGILDEKLAGIHSDQGRELADFVLTECDGKRPKVSPGMNFQALIKRCLYYQDNCPYNTTAPIGCWDTSEVTDFSYAFYNLKEFNDPSINFWDTQSVTDMSDCFGFAESFNQPLNGWSTSAVTDSSDMFWGARSFNNPIGNWDVRNIQNMDYMMLDAVSFDQPLNAWKTDSLTDMKYIFAFAEGFNRPLDGWNTESVLDMTSAFAFATNFDQPLEAWQTGSVTSMKNMFLGASSFNQNVDAWNTLSVQDMTYMFNRAESFNQCLSTWAYKNPTTITGPMIFNGTGCPVQGIPDVITGPWCQGAEDQCFPSSSGESKHPFGLASMLVFGALLVPDIISSFFV